VTIFALKVIASVAMLLDHVGAALLPSVQALRWIGRIALPLYIFMVSEGCAHTRNMGKYMLRMGIFALISEIPFDLAFMQSKVDPAFAIDFLRNANIFYSLFLGIASVFVFEKQRRKKAPAFGLMPLLLIPACIALARFGGTVVSIAAISLVLCELLLCAFLPEHESGKPESAASKVLALLSAASLAFVGLALETDYEMLPILLILAMHLAKGKKLKLIILAAAMVYEYGFHNMGGIFVRGWINYVSLAATIFALSAVALALFYKGKQGIKAKWEFYWFYPVHISIIAFLAIVVVGNA
jgi:hypothetical protein